MNRSLIRTAAIVGCLAGAATMARAHQPPENAPGDASIAAPRMTLEERVAIASEIYAAFPVYFAHWDGVPADLDLKDAYKAYLSDVVAASDRREFGVATMRFMARFRNGHTSFGDGWFWTQLGQPLGFTARPVDQRWLVTASRIEGVRPGDVLATVDGQPVEAFVGTLLPLIAASSTYAARESVFYPQRVEYLFPLAFTLGLADGREVRIDRSASKLAVPPAALETRALEGGRVMYLRIPSFGDPKFENDAVAFVKQNLSAPAMVIDVRGNGGGDTPQALIAALMDRPHRWYSESTPSTPALLRQYFGNAQMRWIGRVTQPKKDAYAGRVILLADALCASSCEDFLVPFKDNARATIVGEPTAGTTGQPYVQTLGPDMNFRISMKRAYFPDGSPFEGVGVAPDVPIRPGVRDLRAGRDVALDAALQLATDRGTARRER